MPNIVRLQDTKRECRFIEVSFDADIEASISILELSGQQRRCRITEQRYEILMIGKRFAVDFGDVTHRDPFIRRHKPQEARFEATDASRSWLYRLTYLEVGSPEFLERTAGACVVCMHKIQ